MKTAILLYVEDGLTDNDLIFAESFTPAMLAERLSGIGDIILSIPESYSGRLNSENADKRPSYDHAAFWKQLFKKRQYDDIVRIYADSPFIDAEVVRDMLSVHRDNLAEFTYSENLPEGLGAEIYSSKLFDLIPDTDEETLPLSKVIRSNINQFDVELYYRGPDIRDRRMSFRLSQKRCAAQMSAIHSIAGSIPPYSELKGLIDANPSVLCQGPSYLEIEITGRCSLDCLFCYRNSLEKQRGDMPPQLFERVINDMREFGLPYTVCFGGSGEPLLHADFESFLKTSCADPLIERVIIETSAADITERTAKLLNDDDSGKIVAIVNINAFSSAGYQQMHGADFFERVMSNLELISPLKNRKGSLFLQVMKINETEETLDSYYDYWEEKGYSIILQKQNTYFGLIEDRRYSDLTPLERTPCWHLARDLFVLADGRVPFCKQDINCLNPRGDLNKDSIKEIYMKSIFDFSANSRQEYPVAPDCKSCDEWYTFNF